MDKLRLKVERRGITIYPENEIDRAYIEDTLGLKNKGDSIKLVRVAPAGLDHALAYLEAKPEKGGGAE